MFLLLAKMSIFIAIVLIHCRFAKDKLIDIMKNRYLEVQSPMANCSFMELVRKVEIEMSKNQKFELLLLSTLYDLFKNQNIYSLVCLSTFVQNTIFVN